MMSERILIMFYDFRKYNGYTIGTYYTKPLCILSFLLIN